MIVLLVLCLLILTYVVCFGITVAISRYSKLFDSFVKSAFTYNNVKKKEFIGLFIVLGPISVICFMFSLVGWFSYKITEQVFVKCRK